MEEGGREGTKSGLAENHRSRGGGQEASSGRSPGLTAESEGRPLHWYPPSLQPAPIHSRESLYQLLVPGPYKNHPKWLGAGCLFVTVGQLSDKQGVSKKAEVGKTFLTLGAEIE